MVGNSEQPAELDLLVEGRKGAEHPLKATTDLEEQMPPRDKDRFRGKTALKVQSAVEGTDPDVCEIVSDDEINGEQSPSWERQATGQQGHHTESNERKPFQGGGSPEDPEDMHVQGVGRSRPSTAQRRYSNNNERPTGYHKYNPPQEVKEMLRRASADGGVKLEDHPQLNVTAKAQIVALASTSMLDISAEPAERPKPYIGKLWSLKYGPQKSAELPRKEPKLKRVGLSRPTSASLDSVKNERPGRTKRPASSFVNRRLVAITPLVYSTRYSSHAADGADDRPSSANPYHLKQSSSDVLDSTVLQDARSHALSGMPSRVIPHIPAQEMAAQVPLPASSADVSYRLPETFVSKEVEGRQQRQEDWDGFPLPPNHSVREVFDSNRGVHEVQLVPDRRPAGRRDAKKASEWVQAEWARLRQKATAAGLQDFSPWGGKIHPPVEDYGAFDAHGRREEELEYIARGNEVLSLGFQELLRQVYMFCTERGKAMEEVWRLHLELTERAIRYGKHKQKQFDRQQSVFSDIKSREDLEAEVERRVMELVAERRKQYDANLEEAIRREEELTIRIDGLERLLDRTANKYERTKRTCWEIAAKTAVLRDMMSDAEEGFAAFLKGKTLSFHGSWSRRPAKELARQRAYEMGIREDPPALCESVTGEKLAAWETMHDRVFDILFQREMDAQGFEAKINNFENEIHRLAQENAALHAEVARMKALQLVVMEEKTTEAKGVLCRRLTDKDGLMDVEEQDEEPGEEVIPERVKFVSHLGPLGLMGMVRGKHRGPLMPKIELLKLIDEFYLAKFEADQEADSERLDKATPYDFFVDWLISKYSLKSVADDKIREVIATVEHHYSSCLPIRTFGRFMGVCRDMDYLCPCRTNKINKPNSIFTVFSESLVMFQRGKVGKRLPERDKETGVQPASRTRVKTEGHKIAAAFHPDWQVAQDLFQRLWTAPNEEDYDDNCVPDLPPDKQSRAVAGDNSKDVDLDLVLDTIIDVAVKADSDLYDSMMKRFIDSDENGDGVMDMSEFKELTQTMGKEARKPLKQAHLFHIFRQMVEDSRGLGDVDTIAPDIFVKISLRHDLYEVEDKHQVAPIYVFSDTKNLKPQNRRRGAVFSAGTGAQAGQSARKKNSFVRGSSFLSPNMSPASSFKGGSRRGSVDTAPAEDAPLERQDSTARRPGRRSTLPDSPLPEPAVGVREEGADSRGGGAGTLQRSDSEALQSDEDIHVDTPAELQSIHPDLLKEAIMERKDSVRSQRRARNTPSSSPHAQALAGRGATAPMSVSVSGGNASDEDIHVETPEELRDIHPHLLQEAIMERQDSMRSQRRARNTPDHSPLR